MPKNLLIVESPAKAKTIEKYLGSDFTVLSSIGHIRSIVKKTKDGKPPIDIKNGFDTTYEIDSEKKKTVADLRKAAKAADTIYLATDPDREGEAIAWHLCEVLKLDPKTAKRVTYNEVSKKAIEYAIKNAHTVDMDLVKAQQARQILDRLVGFELSPVVWQKVPGGKSAGRVQSPAVRLLVEREREIEAFETNSTFKITAVFTTPNGELKAELNKRFDAEADAKTFLDSLKETSFTVSSVVTSPSSRNPPSPYTTSTLQQDANSRLGFGSRATMSSAQKLYQEGKITYMRTDSVNISADAIADAKRYITSAYGEHYSQVRTFKNKNSNAQEAHEAVRLTNIATERGSGNEYDQKLYALIRNRTLASQMSSAKLERTTITIALSNNQTLVFEAKGEVIIFDGFLKVYGGSKKEAPLLPPSKIRDTVSLQSAHGHETFARPPARYTEGSLVKKLEELGIGRPSTYATIISTVQVRGYAEKGEGEGEERDVITYDYAPNDTSEVTRRIIKEKTGADRGKLIPTSSGHVVSDFLSNHFKQIIDYDFTANVENHFDEISSGMLDRNTMLTDFYEPFHKLIENSTTIDRASVAQAREVGIDPKSGKPILARFGRFGPMLQLGLTESEEKPQFAPLPRGLKIESVTLEQALHAFKLPRLVGQTTDGKDIKANIGRFGPYIQVDKLFVSIKPLDPHDVTIDEAREFYAAKLKTEAEKNIADFGDGVKVLNGRFGPFVTDGTKNAKISKEIDPATITHEAALELLKTAKSSKKVRTAKKTTAKRTSAPKVTTKRVVKAGTKKHPTK